ncbi:MAG: YiiX/YebB-like N1pC/P60 family cysteine hydrolase [Myxococcales bacterium]|nr:YiiX/YebB-like N1pC/P60 family cysteine hydrolase [Myxococcales bacterium]
MKKRAGLGFLLSGLLPLFGVVVVLTRVLEGWSRPTGFALWGLGWLSLLYAVRSHQPAAEGLQRARGKAVGFWQRYGRTAAHALVLVAVGAILFTLMPADHVRFVNVPAERLRERITNDSGETERIAQRLQRLSEEHAALFGRQGEVITVEQRGALLGAWLEYLDHAVALDRIVDLHKYFWQINPIAHRKLNARSFLIGYSALVIQTEALARLERSIGDNRAIESLLNDPRPELGIPKGGYAQLKWRLTSPSTLLRLNAGRLHLKLLQTTRALEVKDENVLLDHARKGYERLWKILGREPELFGDNPLEYLESQAFKAWFPVQKGVAEGMGKLRVTDRANFVTPELLQGVIGELEPGDILLERRNWYATNIGLPGFWPHAALYVGTLAEMDAFFESEAERAVTAGLAPSQYLQKELPALHAAFAKADAEGHKPRVIEAIGEGVTLTSLEHSGNADYLAVLRPRLARSVRLASLVRAFGFHGRPYDFNFDFVTDQALVCSELVYKAYEPADAKPGIAFELSKAGGRWVLPPNEIAHFFDRERGAEVEASPLEFVLFFDGNEEAGRAFRRDEAEFRRTWQRPKWDHMQQ